MKVLCTFSISRTGSNFLATVLRQTKGLMVHSEIFHPKEAFSLGSDLIADINNYYDKQFVNNQDPSLIEFVRSHPKEIVNVLINKANQEGYQAIYFKVFNGHFLDNEKALSFFVSCPNFLPIILKRRCIDTYISFRKAQKLGKHTNVSTTDMKLPISLDTYNKWAVPRRNWYHFIEQKFNQYNIQPIQVTYENDINIPVYDLVNHWSNILSKEGIFIEKPHTIDKSKTLHKQDLNILLENKVKNWTSFWEEITQTELENECMGYF